MLSLLELISQNQPHFQTHPALLVLGLQNDFLHPNAKLPVDIRTGFLDRIHALIPTFRRQSANVVWVKTVYETDRLANDPATGEGDVVVGGLVDGVESSTDEDDDLPKDLRPPAQSKSSKHRLRALDLLKRVSARRRPTVTSPHEEAHAPGEAVEEDEELFLRQSAKKGPACQPNTHGAEFVDDIKPEIDPSDTVVHTTSYSAFHNTQLLLILRARLVTELYICGCITNVSVLATVIDAARHGIKINVVGDCLGFRKRVRHDLALKRMVDFFDANIVTSVEVIAQNLRADEQDSQLPLSGSDQREEADLERLGEATPPQQPTSAQTPRQSSTSPLPGPIKVNGQHQSGSDVTVVPSRTTTAAAMSDEHFANMLVRGARAERANQSKAAVSPQSLVKSKIRMRSRTTKTTRKEEELRSPEAEPTQTDKRGLDVAAMAVQRTPVDNLRPANIARAGSSEELRDHRSRSDHLLKPSASQPALLAKSNESKERSSASRVRLALSRSPKSDSNKETTVPLSSPPLDTMPRSAMTPLSPATPGTPKASKPQSLATFPALGPTDRIAEGDSRIVYDFFPPHMRHPSDVSKPLLDLIFTQLYNEVRWQKMLHQQGEVPRLVCCQGNFGADGSMPIYRHPADQTLPLLHFSPKVQTVRKQAENLVGHSLNHVLIQLYRSGNDYISEHSDKTLDIVKGSFIVNVSFGAKRTMRLRTKKVGKVDGSDGNTPRETQRVPLPHNSMFVLGPRSNEKWLHGIMADKRMRSECSQAELDYSGIRISLTFRNIGTFIDAKQTLIWGQGATAKDQREACDVINNDAEETEAMIRAFSRENHAAECDWDKHYGMGFDVLHLHAPPPDVPILFACNNDVENNLVKLFLAENKLAYILCEPPMLETKYELNRRVSFRDNDVNHTETMIGVPTLVYLDRFHPLDRDERGRICNATSYDIVIPITTMMKYWVNRHVPTYLDDFVAVLETLEEQQSFGPGPFIAGRRFSLADCAMWPALNSIIEQWDSWTEARFPALTEYYRMLWKKKKSVQTLRADLPLIRKTDEVKDRAEGADAEKLTASLSTLVLQ